MSKHKVRVDFTPVTGLDVRHKSPPRCGVVNFTGSGSPPVFVRASGELTNQDRKELSKFLKRISRLQTKSRSGSPNRFVPSTDEDLKRYAAAGAKKRGLKSEDKSEARRRRRAERKRRENRG
jgi:hypothetical protein